MDNWTSLRYLREVRNCLGLKFQSAEVIVGVEANQICLTAEFAADKKGTLLNFSTGAKLTLVRHANCILDVGTW
jgi:hypothetical protein